MLISASVQAQAIKESYAFAVLGEPKYAFNFDHFDYANPAAPKGGQITLSALGTFDNFNRYAHLRRRARQLLSADRRERTLCRGLFVGGNHDQPPRSFS